MIVPCGIPLITSVLSEKKPCNLTLWIDFIQFKFFEIYINSIYIDFFPNILSTHPLGLYATFAEQLIVPLRIRIDNC